MEKSKKPVVLISGCCSGIGRAICHEFSKRDFHVAATARKIESVRDIKSDTTGIEVFIRSRLYRYESNGFAG